MSKLFQSYQLKNLNLKNRIVMPPMCMYQATDGKANDWHRTHYTTRAIGGTGMIIVEATAVEPMGRITTEDLGLWADEQGECLQPIVDKCHQQDCAIILQLAHAGRKSEVPSQKPFAPSALPFNQNKRVPIAMEAKDIERVIKAFKASAKRALDAGFDGIEIHGAHGYLINEFLSPLTNKRKDIYGGSLENRMRFLVDIIKAVRQVWPEKKVLMLRLSANEYDPAGNSLQEIAKIAEKAYKMGVDLINVSSGGVVEASIETYPGYQLPLSQFIKEKVGVPTLAGGLISDELLGEQIIGNEMADLVYYGRKLLRNPYFPLNAATRLGLEPKWPTSYKYAPKK